MSGISKNEGSPTSFWRELVKKCKSKKNRASLAKRGTMSVSPKILQFDL